jgi:hypothetical protein
MIGAADAILRRIASQLFQHGAQSGPFFQFLEADAFEDCASVCPAGRAILFRLDCCYPLRAAPNGSSPGLTIRPHCTGKPKNVAGIIVQFGQTGEIRARSR